LDNLLKNFAEYMQSLGVADKKTEEHTIDGKTYVSGQALRQVWPDPLPPAEPLKPVFSVGTLSAAVDLISADLEHEAPGGMLIHIVNYGEVSVVLKASDEWKRRVKLIEVKLPAYEGFPFNKYISHEDFVIKLQQNFVPMDNAAAVEGGSVQESDFNYLARISSTITASAVTGSETDGIAQNVSVKRTVNSGLKELAELRRTVALAPYRTFMELPQPVSTFLFRAKDMGEGSIPNLGLFEVDGGMWRKIAVGSIRQYLEEKLKETTFNIPIVS
jgi:hypothetical protein